MSLQQALDNCLIDFDRRVLVTDLMEEYKLAYEKAHDVLEAYIKRQETSNATKYEKRFVVNGMQSSGEGELYTIVKGEMLQEWLSKLQNAQSHLYSVEVAGGSKSPAPIFKPMQHLEVQLDKLEQRAGVTVQTNGISNEVNKPTVVAKQMSVKEKPPMPSATKDGKEKDKEKEKEKEKTSPSDAKVKPTASAKKGSIGSFFSATPAPKSQAAKETKPTVAKPSASSMDNFFKKQPKSSSNQTKPSPTSSIKKEPSPDKNKSVQLFDEESEASSDEEEKLDKLRRKVIGSGDESDETDAPKASRSANKRRRIVDSDDEEQPQKKSAEPQPEKQKEEVVAEVEPMEVEAATNETFLDDDGFVITVKAKKPNQQAAKEKASSPAASATASVTASASASVPATKKKSPPAASKSAKETPKVKQGSITSFFTKK